MSERDDPGHAPRETDDECYAPVTRGSDWRGRTVPGAGTPGTSGTGVPGVATEWADARDDWRASLRPDEEGVERAEREDDSR
ncbi:hypothetical protein [Actinomadura rayongensis]|uniref:Uncharacterized protein n=1 Tax=Actinomadura rayongensis TaxID=1429076 RepID=A0A6I4W674_9ACTN|nr:hypothetical protein [Actinomadura rayongensis]MXQ66239.1 hypothetical protein [Actinomadura rayongensis]